MIRNQNALNIAIGGTILGIIATVLIALDLAWVFPCVIFASSGLNLINAFRDPPSPPDAGDEATLGVGA